MNETLEYIQTFARFPFALRKFLQHRLTLDEAKRIVRERMEHREENFLGIIEKSVYGYPRSPYLPLLKMAGCELGDLRALVKQKGLEGALRVLREEGVYVTFEEFKGRKPIERGGLTLKVSARDFDNPFARRDFAMTSGGSTGLATAVHQNLDFTAARAPSRMLIFAAHGVLGVPMAMWSYPLPGSGLRSILERACFGMEPEQWFSPQGWHDSKHWIKYGLATLYMIGCMRLNGMRVPLPKTVKVDQALVVARWITQTLKTHRRCLLTGGVSRAVRVCLVAEQNGLNLRGAAMWIAGEPVTPTKAAILQRMGVSVIPSYTMTEAGAIGSGCARPAMVNDLHLLNDVIALITHPYRVPGLDITVPAFNLTSLLQDAPKVLLNVQSDDYGVVEQRACGCELETYGYTTHLYDIHSYSKLVSEGATLIGNEMLAILEQVLPARFGGSPLDYQLLEQEDERGFTRLYLVISPQITIQDEQEVISLVLNGLRKSSSMADAARTVWQNAQTIQIKRMNPIQTARGKLLPLHIERRTRKSNE